MYWSEPTLSGRMNAIDVRRALLKQDDPAAGQTASLPNTITPPQSISAGAPPGAEMQGGPSPEEMDALMNSPKVYGSTEEALSDWEQRLSDIATDITAHIGTVGQTRYSDNLEAPPVFNHSDLLAAFRQQVEKLRLMAEITRSGDPSMTNHGIGMGDMGGMPPEMGALQNMPAPGPAGMPPGGMPMPGPMGGL